MTTKLELNSIIMNMLPISNYILTKSFTFIFQRWDYMFYLLFKKFRFFCEKLIYLRSFEEKVKKNYIK